MRALRKKIMIEVEGNVTSKEMTDAIKKGANLVVSGYKGSDLLTEFRDMRAVITKFKYNL